MLKEKIITLNDNGNTLKFRVRQLTATEQEKLIIKILLLVANKDIAELDVDKLRENPQMAINSKVLLSALEKSALAIFSKNSIMLSLDVISLNTLTISFLAALKSSE